MQYAEKHLFAEQIGKYMRENSPPETMNGDERNNYESRLKAAKLQWMDDISISVSVLNKLIFAFGISLTELELEDLVCETLSSLTPYVVMIERCVLDRLSHLIAMPWSRSHCMNSMPL